MGRPKQSSPGAPGNDPRIASPSSYFVPHYSIFISHRRHSRCFLRAALHADSVASSTSPRATLPPRPIRSPFLTRSRTSPTLLPAVVLELNITDFADPHETQAMPWLSRQPVESAVMIPRDEHSSQGQDLPHQFDLEPTRHPRWNFYEFSLLGGKMNNFSELFLQMEMMSWKSIFLVACRGVSA